MKEDLISNYKNNNELAIEDIVAQYSNYVYKIIKNISKNISNEDTEEILLDVFMAVWNNREKLKEELSLKPYIVGVTKNAIKNKSRNIKITYNIEEYNIENFTDINEIIEQGEKNKIISKELNTMKQEDNIVISELMSAKDYFPKAKKLYIQVVGVGYNKENGRYKALSNSEWNIELNIPEKFYNEDVVEYKTKENSYVDIEKMMVTSTSTTFVANIKEDNKLRLEISIIDNNGKEYKTKIMNFDAKNKEKVICKFPLKSDMITEKMYLKINAEEKEEQYELIKK